MLSRPNFLWIIAAFALLSTSATQAQTQLKWKLSPGAVLKYSLTQDSDTAMNVGGQMITTKMTLVMNSAWNVAQVDSAGVADVTQSFEGIKFKLNSAAFNLDFDSNSTTEPTDPIGKQIAKSIKPLSQAKFNFKLSPRGEVSDVTVPEESQKLLQSAQTGPQMAGALTQESLIGMIKDSVLPFPAKQVQKGESWKHKSEIKAPPIGTMSNETTLTYGGPTQVDGKQLEQIQIEVSSKLTGNGANPLVQVAIKDQSEKGMMYFDNAGGRLSHWDSIQNLVMDVSAAGQKFEQTVKTTKKANLSMANK